MTEPWHFHVRKWLNFIPYSIHCNSGATRENTFLALWILALLSQQIQTSYKSHCLREKKTVRDTVFILGDKLSEECIFPHGNTIIICDVDNKLWRIREKMASCSVLVLMPKFIFLEPCLHTFHVLWNIEFLVCSTICPTVVAMVLEHCQYPQIIFYSLTLLLFPLPQTLQNHQSTVSQSWQACLFFGHFKCME